MREEEGAVVMMGLLLQRKGEETRRGRAETETERSRRQQSGRSAWPTRPSAAAASRAAYALSYKLVVVYVVCKVCMKNAVKASTGILFVHKSICNIS